MADFLGCRASTIVDAELVSTSDVESGKQGLDCACCRTICTSTEVSGQLGQRLNCGDGAPQSSRGLTSSPSEGESKTTSWFLPSVGDGAEPESGSWDGLDFLTFFDTFGVDTFELDFAKKADLGLEADFDLESDLGGLATLDATGGVDAGGVGAASWG